MALVWNPITFQYDWSPDTTVGGLGTADPRAALAGTIVSGLPSAQQYGLAARATMPGYTDRPYMSSMINRMYDPLYGQYLSGYGGFLGEDVAPEKTFAQWLRTPTGGIAAQQAGAGQSRWGGLTPGGMMTAGAGGLPDPALGENWQNIIETARSLAPGSGYDPASGGIADYGRWVDMLQDPSQAAALTSMATYDPRAGSIFGKLRQKGLQRKQQSYLDRNPGATAADWLGYLANPESSLTGTQWQVPLTDEFTSMIRG